MEVFLDDPTGLTQPDASPLQYWVGYSYFLHILVVLPHSQMLHILWCIMICIGFPTTSR